eukprot:TRINITY_DN36631_c0_g1_i1.p1 TRINITY_DN36631_c0_g1~~TRINITY_DN36631_c0_g1_i1.p1  ORF type:complete len:690 (+),score=104.93 TRINITY_DN36631_c0_g1_i1:37-2070(+)
MGSAASARRSFSAKQKQQYAVQAAPDEIANDESGLWQLPGGGLVVAVQDFEPQSTRWPENCLPALRLRKSVAITVLRDTGDEYAFGYPVGQSTNCGYFLKSCTSVLNAVEPKVAASARMPSLSDGHEGLSANSGERLREPQKPQATRGLPSLYEPLEGWGSLPRSPASTFNSPQKRFADSPMASTAATTAGSPGSLSTTGMSIASMERSSASSLSAKASPGPAKVLQASLNFSQPGNSNPLPNKSPHSTQRQSQQEQLMKSIAEAAGSAAHTAVQAPHANTGPQNLPKAVQAAARSLGLDVQQDVTLLWLAEHAARVNLPEDWVHFTDDEGQAAFYHAKTKRVTRQHPMMERYRRYIIRLRRLREKQEKAGLPVRAAIKVRPHLAVILNECLNRTHRELPPVTPEILERVAVLLGIDTPFDFGLATKLKAAMELFVEDQYDISVATGQKADVDSFLTDLRDEQVKHEVLEKPEGVIMCSEFEDRPAAVKCQECMDFFSLEGFSKTHVSGKRKRHTPLKVEQLACSVFPEDLATCEVGGTYFCDRGYEDAIRRNPGLRFKHRTILGGPRCSEYPDRIADVLCEDCCDMFCWEAFIEFHNHGHRQQHVPLQFRGSILHRDGQPLPPEEASRIMSRSRLARDGGPWLAFRDDQLNTYWYHLSDKVITHENPYFGSYDSAT